MSSVNNQLLSQRTPLATLIEVESFKNGEDKCSKLTGHEIPFDVMWPFETPGL